MIYGKLEAVDAWDALMPTKDVRRDLVVPVMTGEKEHNEHLDYIVDYVYKEMLRRKDFLKTVGLAGKTKYYPEGDWHYPTNKPMLRLDIEGADCDICPQMIKDRLKKFLYMTLERDLFNTLVSLGYEVRYATGDEDRLYKIDLMLKIDGEVYGVAVFRSDIQTAIYKLRYLKQQGGHRVYFQVPSKSNTATNEEKVEKWVKEIKDNKHQFILQDGRWRYTA